MSKQSEETATLLSWLKSFQNSKSHYVLYIPLAIYIFKALGTLLVIIQNEAPKYGLSILSGFKLYATGEAAAFFGNFIEWFGVLYGFLLPLILVRVWEQFDEIDREFDKEADSVKILSENLRLLSDENLDYSKNIIKSLVKYIDYVKKHYHEEASNDTVRNKGDKILREIREQFKELIHPKILGREREPESLISEIIKQLDNIIDIRGDRISLSNERLFDVLRTIGLVTSIMFLVPFYYVGFTPQMGFMENMLIIGVTILVILIYVILDDLDEPYGGIWKIEPDSWDRVRKDIEAENKAKFIQ